MSNKHMKRCSTLLAIREMRITTKAINHCTPIRMAKMETVMIHTADDNEPHASLWEPERLQPLWKRVQQFLIKLQIHLPYSPVMALLGICSREMKTCPHKNLPAMVYRSFIYGSPLQRSCLGGLPGPNQSAKINIYLYFKSGPSQWKHR